MGRLLGLVKFAPKLGLAIQAAKPLIRVFARGLKASYDDVKDERIKEHLLELEARVGKLEETVTALEERTKKLTTIVYILAGVAIAALLLSIIKLA